MQFCFINVLFFFRTYRSSSNRKVAGSIPASVSGFFIDIKSFRSHYALGSTQPLTEMSTRSISWGKGGRCVRLTTLPPSRAVVMKSGNLNFLEPSGPLQACNGTALPLRLLVRLGRTEFMWFSVGTGDCCDYGHEPSGCIKCGTFLK